MTISRSNIVEDRSVHQKILSRMNDLQEAMESNKHLENTEEVILLMNSVSKFWTLLSEEDRDYIQCVQHAIEDQLEWNV